MKKDKFQERKKFNERPLINEENAETVTLGLIALFFLLGAILFAIFLI